MTISLVERTPAVSPAALIDGLVPPPLFADARFDTYHPDPAEPSQLAAREAARTFAEALGATAPRGRRRHRVQQAGGIYLDGGFGVGKTHLLAALWHAAPAPKAYATFVELTQLAGALGFAATVEQLSGMRLLAIDEFELDDPGDTVLVSSLLARLAEHGVALAATSNTLPDRLGEGRFAAEDFLREIQQLAARFTTVRVDGPDYRHRGLPEAPTPLDDATVREHAAATDGASLDDFGALLRHLATLHPSRYGALLDGVSSVHLLDVLPAPDQSVALRLVVLADRLYDRQLPLVTSGVSLDQLFDESMLAGGYRKKYRRAISRLVALSRLGVSRGA
ncbi:cell division protein ZapE [Jatrophihabitans sp.]|uniref:cell division protein ZapE n=1 Tax=Jatrophihabitans sp. TaxID=1932789 RepID=UPI0030C6FF5B|nr:cell division protein ZapE [Jatrophihabitans sp.]